GGSDADDRATYGWRGIEEHQVSPERRNLILFYWVKSLDGGDHVVAKTQPVNTFKVKGRLLQVGAQKHAHQIAACNFSLFHDGSVNRQVGQGRWKWWPGVEVQLYATVDLAGCRPGP